MNDPVERFLDADFSGQSPVQLRERLLVQTTRLLRRRRVYRRLAWAGAVAASFLAGMATVLLRHFSQGREVPENTLAADNTVMMEKSSPISGPSTLTPHPSPLDLEWRAFDSKDNRAALFLAAAKSYLDERQDYVSAARCYRQALDELPAEELAVHPDDNWLVMALKEARLKEMNDAIGNP